MAIQRNPGHRGDPLFLPDVLRAFGLKVWEDPDWRGHGHGDFDRIQGVIAHHTAGGGSRDWLIVRDGRPGLDGPLSQLVLEKDGTYRVVAAGVCWHAGRGSWAPWPRDNANAVTIGIEAVSKGTPPYDWTDEQIDAFVRGTGAILWYLGLNADRVAGHREYSSEGKIDPAGIDMNWFRGEVQKVINAGPTGEGDELMGSYTNHKGEKVDAMVGLSFIDKHVGLILDQLGGPGTRDGEDFPGWDVASDPDTGEDLTLVEAIGQALSRAAKAEKLAEETNALLKALAGKLA